MDDEREGAAAPPDEAAGDETVTADHVPELPDGTTEPIPLGGATGEPLPATDDTGPGGPTRLTTGAPVTDQTDTETPDTSGAAVHEPAPEAAGPETATGAAQLSTRCPVCGNTTAANRFCSFCGAPLTAGRGRGTGQNGDPIVRLAGRAHDALFPGTQPIDMLWHRVAVPAAIVIALIALLANDIGVPLIVGAALAPVLLILTLRQLDLFERESPLLSLGAAVAGAIGGLIIGGIMSWATREWWFSGGGFYYGAAGYGEEFARRAGHAPFLLILVDGIVLPAIGVATMLVGPIALRRFAQFRNEAMDGLILGALGGAGYAIGTVIVFVLPVIGDGGPALTVRHWTLLILGLTLFRPLILTAGAAIFAAGLWRSMMTERTTMLILPAAAGVGGIVLLYLGTMILEPRSLALEVIWNLLLTLALLGVLSLVLRQAIAFDRRVIGANNSRVACPSCGQATPRGAYCAHCGQPLPAMDAV